MKESYSVSTSEASLILGMDRDTLTRWLRVGKCPFGFYVPPDVGKKGHYYINRERLQAYVTARDLRFNCPYANQVI